MKKQKSPRLPCYSDFQNSVPKPDPTFNRNIFMATAVNCSNSIEQATSAGERCALRMVCLSSSVRCSRSKYTKSKNARTFLLCQRLSACPVYPESRPGGIEGSERKIFPTPKSHRTHKVLTHQHRPANVFGTTLAFSSFVVFCIQQTRSNPFCQDWATSSC
ncbi:hypothetical protein D3OALGB2SA_5365 [Olavius algarvensis associated proteobacterium Delta 3]|nr:hypothetical protein D3OALGB2SA_5365 [Olavius algarvensis associated proteobacterium Delta 3]